MGPKISPVELTLVIFLCFCYSIQICTCNGLASVIGHECGEVTHRASGMIMSPKLPNSFSRAVLCKWKIIVPEKYNQLSIYVWLKPGKKLSWELKHCLSDHLAINQFIDGRKEKREKYCGKYGFFRTRTFGREAEIRFWRSPTRSNGNDGHTAFRLLWVASAGCSTDVHGRRGIIQSPNYPNSYPSDTFCTWRVTTPFKAGSVKVKFVKFDLQGHSPNCRKDYLLVKDSDKKTVGKYCGRNIPRELILKGNSVTFIFKSNKRKNFPGFKIAWSAEYKLVDDGACGVTHFPPSLHPRQRRFVGGYVPHKGTMPWMVQIVGSEYVNGNTGLREMSCGGALISDQWILTAAHCVLPFRKRMYRVYLGGHGNRDLSAVIGSVDKIHIHPAYMGSMTNDIALVKLKEKQTSSYMIRTICLPNSKTAEEIKEDSQCWMGGWGRTGDDNLASDQLKISRLTYKGHCTFRPDLICAQSPDEKKRIGPCGGDSGGPLVCKMANGRFVLAGVLSHGPKLCGSQQDYYADTAYYTEWIAKTIQENGPAPKMRTNDNDKNTITNNVETRRKI